MIDQNLMSRAVDYAYSIGNNFDYEHEAHKEDFIQGALSERKTAERSGFMLAVDLLKEYYPANSDGPYRSGEWFAEKLIEFFKEHHEGI